MDRQQLEKLFDEKFDFLDNKSVDELKQFIFDTVIPEVIKSVVNGKLGGHQDEIQRAFAYGWDSYIDDIKKKAKDLYGITL